MSTPAVTPYRARLFIRNGSSYFTIACCPNCNPEFRLLWPVTVLTYPETAIMRLKCPGCQSSFDSDQLAAGKIFHVGGNDEHYLASPVEVELRK